MAACQAMIDKCIDRGGGGPRRCTSVTTHHVLQSNSDSETAECAKRVYESVKLFTNS